MDIAKDFKGASEVALKKLEMPPNHFDPTDELTEQEILSCSEKAEKILLEENNKELNLEKSDITIPDQEWCLVSFVGETCAQKSKELGMKILGVFPDIKSAKLHANKLNKIDPTFDIFILEMYTWAVVPPNPEYIKDNNYHEEKLHELVTEHKRQQLKVKEVFNLRKKKLMENEDINRFNKNKQELAELMNSDTSKDELSKDEPSKDEPIQNDSAYKEIFGEPIKLPKLEIVSEPLPEIPDNSDKII